MGQTVVEPVTTSIYGVGAAPTAPAAVVNATVAAPSVARIWRLRCERKENTGYSLLLSYCVEIVNRSLLDR